MKACRLNPCRIINVALLGILLVLLFRHPGFPYRWVRYKLTDTVHCQGAVFHLHPRDQVLTNVVIRDGIWEPTLTATIRAKLQPGQTFIDVGANVGYYTIIASKIVGDSGRVVAFEPEPENFAILQHNVEANGCKNVVLVQKALADKPGSLTLMLSSKNKGAHSLFHTQEIDDHPDTVQVDTVRLDDWLREHQVRPDLVKIDTEGAEGIIVEGMSETLRNNGRLQLVLEFSPSRLDDSGYGASRLLNKLQSAGMAAYEVEESEARLVPVAYSEVFGRPSLQQNVCTNLFFEHHAGRNTSLAAF